MKFRNFVGVFLASFIRLSQFGKHFTDYVESENQFVQFQLTKNKPVNGSGTSKGGPPPPNVFQSGFSDSSKSNAKLLRG